MSHPHRPLCVFTAILLALMTTGCREPTRTDPLTLYDLHSRRTITGIQAVESLKVARLVLVGEHHTDPSHHAAQLNVIRTLHDAGIPAAIGIEMFRKDQQAALDRWIAGKIDERAFEAIYLDNWNFPWNLYREIFIYARQNKIPLLGLNVSRAITRQVAQNGFASLSTEQRDQLEGITCNVTREYRDFIRNAFGAHGHGNMDFVRFCEAQLVWDTAMAINALSYLNRHTDRTMVLLAGSGHARKMGIPYQVSSRSPIPLSVMLPMTSGIFDPDNLTPEDADFIILP